MPAQKFFLPGSIILFFGYMVNVHATAKQCLGTDPNKVCVGEVVISHQFYSFTGESDVIAAKVVGIVNGNLLVDGGAGYDPTPVELNSVVPLASLRDQNACIQSPQICSCDEFESDGQKRIAIAGLNDSQATRLNFTITKTTGVLFTAQDFNLGTAQILSVPDQQTLQNVVTGQHTILSPSNPNLLRNFKSIKSTAQPGSCFTAGSVPASSAPSTQSEIGS